MYDRFTDRARKVMQLANQEAQRLNHEYIGTEHILLGMVREGGGVGMRAVSASGINVEKIRDEIMSIVQRGPDMITMGKLPQTPRARQVIQYALEEAKSLDHNYVGTEHLLLGLLREQEGVASQVLVRMGVQSHQMRASVLNLLGASPSEERMAQKIKDNLRPREKTNWHAAAWIITKFSPQPFTPFDTERVRASVYGCEPVAAKLCELAALGVPMDRIVEAAMVIGRPTIAAVDDPAIPPSAPTLEPCKSMPEKALCECNGLGCLKCAGTGFAT